MEEVLRVAKVGSKRTPSHPVSCSEAHGGREGSERRLYPQMKEQWPRFEGRKKLVSPRVSGDQETFKQWREVKDPLTKKLGCNNVIKPGVELKSIAWSIILR